MHTLNKLLAASIILGLMLSGAEGAFAAPASNQPVGTNVAQAASVTTSFDKNKNKKKATMKNAAKKPGANKKFTKRKAHYNPKRRTGRGNAVPLNSTFTAPRN